MAKVTLMDCAYMSEDVYHDNVDAVSGWRRVDGQCWPSGFAAQTYEKEGAFVVAFRGTDDGDDWAQNFQMAPTRRIRDEIEVACKRDNPMSALCEVGFLALKNAIKSRFNKIPGEYSSNARKYVANLGMPKAVSAVTGHSLGGALALVVGQENSIPCVTFNAPMMGGLNGMKRGFSEHVVHVHSRFDPVRGATKMLGSAALGREVEVAVPVPMIGFNNGFSAAGFNPINFIIMFVKSGLHFHGMDVLLRKMESQRSLYGENIARE